MTIYIQCFWLSNIWYKNKIIISKQMKGYYPSVIYDIIGSKSIFFIHFSGFVQDHSLLTGLCKCFRWNIFILVKFIPARYGSLSAVIVVAFLILLTIQTAVVLCTASTLCYVSYCTVKYFLFAYPQIRTVYPS